MPGELASDRNDHDDDGVATTTTTTTTKPRWGDAEMAEKSDNGTKAAAAAAVVEGPDENGIKTVTEFIPDEKGQPVKVVRRFKVQQVTHAVNKSVAERQKWQKFGAAAGHKAGPDPSTTNIAEEAPLKLGSRITAESLQDEAENAPSDTLNRTDKLMVCRICKGNHWTRSCPLRDITELSGLTEDMESSMSLDSPDRKSTPGKYVPPGKRMGESSSSSSSMRNRDDDYTVRVSNLPPDIHERDLDELFRRFKSVTRIKLVKDKRTKTPKDFAYISFMDEENAAEAIRKINGHRYSNLILNVDWSPSRRSSGRS